MKKIFAFFILLMLLSSYLFSQNVGIGTTTPTRAKLEVNGAVDATSAIFGGESSGISLQRNWPGIGYNSYWNAGNRSIISGFGAKQYLDPTTGYLYLDMLPYTNTNDLATTAYRAFTISPGGNIGVGSGTPNAELQLPNTILNRKIVLWESANNENQYFGLGIEPGTMRYSVAGAGNVHRFYAGTGPTSSSLLMSIWADRTVIIGDDNGGGKLGINLGSPGYTLSLKQAGGTGIYLQEAASGSNWEFRAQYTAQTDYGVLLIRHDNNDVGWFTPNGTYVSVSDRRLKTNIEDLPPTLEKVMQLQPRVYEMKINNPQHEKTLGFIAQEVKPLFPELVVVNENSRSDGKSIENLNALSYSGFGIIAIKAIQEQQKIIEKQQTQIDELKKQLENIERKIINQ
jgi:hypothetical protein